MPEAARCQQERMMEGPFLCADSPEDEPNDAASDDASDDAAADDVQLTSGAGPSSSEDAKDEEEPGVDEDTGDNGESGPARQRRYSFGHRDPAPSDENSEPLLDLCRSGEITPEALERRSQAEAKNKDYVRRSLSRAVEWQ